MAVFTSVSLSAFNGWVRAHYSGGGATALSPVSEGIENTNYRVSMDGNDYIFTIFELWDDIAVDYYAAFMQHLNAAGLPVPAAVRGENGGYRYHWGDKPCLLVPFVRGGWIAAPDATHCEKIGALLAQMHLAAATYAKQHPNPRNGSWRRQAAAQVRRHLSSDLQQLLDTALADDARFCQAPLPTAACHCDLFRNNVLWQDERIAAVIDFYFGGDDSLIFDIAVCACDWCTRPGAQGGSFDAALLSALIRGYNSQRRLCELEKSIFIEALGSAAVRFWLSRQYDLLFPRQAQQLTPHSPQRFEQILRTIHSGRESLARLMQAAA